MEDDDDPSNYIFLLHTQQHAAAIISSRLEKSHRSSREKQTRNEEIIKPVCLLLTLPENCFGSFLKVHKVYDSQLK